MVINPSIEISPFTKTGLSSLISLMNSQITITQKLFAMHSASIVQYFMFSVLNFDVFFPQMSGLKRSKTQCALIQLFYCVAFLMGMQTFHFAERFAADVAVVWFFSRVNFFVHAKDDRLGEGFTAYVAVVRLAAAVGFLVSVESHLLRKRALAYVALE